MRRNAPRDAGVSDGQVLGSGSLTHPLENRDGLSGITPRPRAHGGRLPRSRLSRMPTFVAQSVRARGMGRVMARRGGGGDKWS